MFKSKHSTRSGEFVEVNSVNLSYPVPNISMRGKEKLKKLSNVDKLPGSKKFGAIETNRNTNIQALRDVSFNMPAGSTTALIGLNGSGKSSLLKVMGGILSPTEGTVEMSDLPTGIFSLKQGLRMEASGYRNILLRAIVMGKTDAEVKERMPLITKFSELDHYLEMPLSAYSSGMIMRLVFSVMVAFQPKILLMDEWIGAADEDFREKVSEWLVNFCESNGILLLASHTVSLLRKTCQNGIVLHQGAVACNDDLEVAIKAYRALRAKHSSEK